MEPWDKKRSFLRKKPNYWRALVAPDTAGLPSPEAWEDCIFAWDLFWECSDGDTYVTAMSGFTSSKQNNWFTHQPTNTFPSRIDSKLLITVWSTCLINIPTEENTVVYLRNVAWKQKPTIFRSFPCS